MDKRNLGRFCIQFNMADARHLQVIKLLEAQGRRKAQYISEAILHYANCAETPDIQVRNDIASLKPMIESIVRQLLKNEKPHKESTSGIETLPVLELTEADADIPMDLEGAIDADLLAAMQESISSLRDENHSGK